MKLSLKSALKISLLSALAIAPILMSGNGASAQTVPTGKGLEGSFVGGGAGISLSNPEGQEAKVGGNISGRFDVPNAPVSFRGDVNYNDKTSAFLPKISYDLGVAKDTNVYAAVGYNFVQKDAATSTALGDKNAPVVSLGAERKVSEDVIIYGNADLAINAFENSDRQAIGVNAGVALKIR